MNRQLVNRFVSLTDERKLLEDSLEAVISELEKVKLALALSMTADGVKSFVDDGSGDRLSVSVRIFASISNPIAFKDWAKKEMVDIGSGERASVFHMLYKETVHPGTLSSFTKERFLANVDTPFVIPYFKLGVQRRKSAQR